MDYNKIRDELKKRNIDKVYVPDTNVLVTNPFAWYILSGNELPDNPETARLADLVRGLRIKYSRDPNAVALVSTVESELDRVKSNDRKPDFVRLCANTALRNLEQILTTGGAPELLPKNGLPFGDALYLEVPYEEAYARDFNIYAEEINGDTQIALATARLAKELKDVATVEFVSDDAGARVKALRLGVRAAPFRYETVKNINDLYSGRVHVTLPIMYYDEFKERHRLRTDEVKELRNVKPNQVVEISAGITQGGRRRTLVGFVDEDGRSISTYKEYRGVNCVKTARDTRTKEGDGKDAAPIYIRFNQSLQLTRDQGMLMELLRTERITCVTVAGSAGTGKTLCTLLAALQQIQEGRYQRVVYSRPLVTMGAEIGFLPGDVKRKMQPWAEPAHENLQRIFNYDGAPFAQKEKIRRQIDELQQKGFFTVEPPSFIPGRTLTDSLIIVDEAHYFTREQLKMWLSRVGLKSKIVFIGDPEQIMNGKGTFVTKANNGLVHAIDKLPGHPLFGHLRLREVKRSATADLANLL